MNSKKVNQPLQAAEGSWNDDFIPNAIRTDDRQLNYNHLMHCPNPAAQSRTNDGENGAFDRSWAHTMTEIILQKSKIQAVVAARSNVTAGQDQLRRFCSSLQPPMINVTANREFVQPDSHLSPLLSSLPGLKPKPEILLGGVTTSSQLSTQYEYQKIELNPYRFPPPCQPHQKNSDPQANTSAQQADSSLGHTIAPCPAQRMPIEHNFRTAYFTMKEGIKHEDELICSFASCRNSGIKYRYCGFCKVPVSKRNFFKLHAHDAKYIQGQVKKAKKLFKMTVMDDKAHGANYLTNDTHFIAPDQSDSSVEDSEYASTNEMQKNVSCSTKEDCFLNSLKRKYEKLSDDIVEHYEGT